ncbi:IS200/IS605 family transposase [Tenuifilum sp.]|jgi:REP element-mobilizing transposase RayT|uniref:IS200/IS605 family transposase n=1 Tax=Tenuifilum sp. TaxID=2760880 RepID=UPI002BC04833|nr:transposase [Bacteroidales bacterium]HOU73321.1 transposase [Tenuifilum sp.]HQE53924.1 transposase [Tenuifilum sp.]HQG71604.1 transposase [Tenuifilum sp.]HQI88607.1 transposase [Tenuifilum sp.]
MPDHIHIFIGYNVNQLIPNLVENIKTSSNAWEKKEEKLSKYKFEWQRGYEAFSHSRSQLDTVVKYIQNQEQHQKKSFRNEYLEILRKIDIKYQYEYLFEFFENGGVWD